MKLDASLAQDQEYLALPPQERAKVVEFLVQRDQEVMALPDEEKVKVLNHFVNLGTRPAPIQQPIRQPEEPIPEDIEALGAGGMLPPPKGYTTPGDISLGAVGLLAGGAAGVGARSLLTKVLPKLSPYKAGIVEGAVGGGVGAGVVGGDAEEGAGIGAGVSAVLPPMLKYGAKSAGWLADAVRGRLPDVQLGKLMRDTAGKSADDIRTALANAPKGTTAAQAAAGVDNDVWQALGEVARRHDPGAVYRLIDDKQLMDELGTLSKMARGRTAEEAATSREWMKKRLEAALKPVREGEIHKAGIAGTETGEVSAKLADIRKQMSYSPEFSGMMPELYTQAKQGQKYIEDIYNAGLRPLNISPILSKIDRIKELPETRISPSELKVLDALKEKLSIAGKGGVDPAALYGIRKKGINEIIDTLGDTGQLTKESAKAALIKLRPMIDDAFEEAGATQWGKGYLTKYRKGFEAIDRAEVMNGLRELYETNPKRYIEVVRGNDPEFIQQFIPNAKGVTALFSENVTGKLNTLANKADIKMKMAERARGAETALGDIMKRDVIKWRLPQFINYWFAAGNKGITALEEMVDRKVMIKLVDSMKSGQSALDAMNALPASERNMVLKAMQKSEKMVPKLTTAATVEAQQQ